MSDQQTPENVQVQPLSRPYQELQKRLGAEWAMEKDIASFDIASQVIDAIMTAETVDDVFAANSSGVQDIKEYLGQPIHVTDVSFRQSAEKFRGEGLGFYVVIDAITDDGEEIKLTAGGPNIVSSMYKMRTLGAISEAQPLKCKIIGRETANGTLHLLAKAS